MKKIYLACPYSHKDPEIRINRFLEANKAAAKLMEDGNIVYSPISHCHPIALVLDNELDGEFWQAQDDAFVDWCDELYVLKIDGYKESTGVNYEIDRAKDQDKSITFITL